MTVTEFVVSIPEFGKLNFSEQIKRFCWYLTRHAGKEQFSGTDVLGCFSEAKCPRPTSISSFLKSLCSRKPAVLIYKAARYHLTRSALDQFDAMLGKREATVAVDALLESLAAKITLAPERQYLEEALICFRHKAFRAAVVMTWNVAYDHLCNLILSKHLVAFNTQLPKSFPKADVLTITTRDDFEALKESQVIQVAKSASIVSGSVHKILKEKLDRRNIAAHPSGVQVSHLTAEDFISDLIQNVVLKF